MDVVKNRRWRTGRVENIAAALTEDVETITDCEPFDEKGLIKRLLGS